MHEERRTAQRHPFFAAVEISEPRSEYSVTARTNELSRGGCYVDMRSPLFPDAELRVRIVHGGEVLELDGRVVHSEPNVGMGVAFTRTEPSSSNELLDRWLESLDAAASR